MPSLLRVLALGLLACTPPDPQRFFEAQAVYLRPGVGFDQEEREVRRVFAQRGLRLVARFDGPTFIALGAASRGGEESAVRVISQRGVVVAEDASQRDLFAPGSVALIEHFGGSLGDYVLVASARVPAGRDVGCLKMHRILPDGRALEAVLDVAVFGSRACVVNVAPARAGRVRATIGFPGLHALTTPTLEAELVLVEPLLGRPEPEIPVFKLARDGDWLERERARLATVPLARAEFSLRHAVGVARAALSAFLGHDSASQLGSYREAVQRVPSGSAEAMLVAETSAHIERGWLDAGSAPTPKAGEGEDAAPASGDDGRGPPSEAGDEAAPGDAIPPDATLIEPEQE